MWILSVSELLPGAEVSYVMANFDLQKWIFGLSSSFIFSTLRWLHEEKARAVDATVRASFLFLSCMSSSTTLAIPVQGAHASYNEVVNIVELYPS